MYAAEEESKLGELLCDEKMAVNGIEDRLPSQKLTESHNKLFNHMKQKKTDSNTFSYGFRVFKVSPSAKLGFPNISELRRLYSKVLGAAYIFKLHYPHTEGYTHGLHVRINGYAPRKMLDTFISDMAALFIGEKADLKPVMPRLKKDVSLFDYLQTLYVVPANLLVNYSHKQDALPEECNIKLDYATVSKLKQRMVILTTQILDTILSMPTRYKETYMAQVLAMSPFEFKRHMRQTDINQMTLRAGENAYSMALQDYQFKTAESQELLDPLTRRSMLSKCITDKTTKQIQLLLQDTFRLSFVHPHPCNTIIRSDLHRFKALDGCIFDPKFLFPLLMASRWLTKSCFRDEDVITNNHAHLLLYGDAGTGKTLIVSSIASSIATYKYLANSRFQNPELLQSAVFSIEEFDTVQLASNMYKSLLDIKAPIKIDFKNLHPENASEGVPCMITSNDNVLTVLKTQKKYPQTSQDAAIRRLYMIPLKMGQFEKLHGKVPTDNIHHFDLMQFDPKFETEPHKLFRIFNLMVAFGLHQEDITGLALDKRLHSYVSKITHDFRRTVFGTFYLSNKDKIDQLLKNVEAIMMRQDLNDSEYLSQVCVAVGQFQQLQTQYLRDMTDKLEGIKQEVITDIFVPQPIKHYYLTSKLNFIAKLMWQLDENKTYLNKEVEQFIKNPDMQLFTLADQRTNHYEELVSASSSVRDPFEDPPEEKESKVLPQPVLSPQYPDPLDEMLPKKRSFIEMLGMEDYQFAPALQDSFDQLVNGSQ